MKFKTLSRLITTGFLMGALLLAACDDGAGASTATPSPTATNTATETATGAATETPATEPAAFPVAVETAYGEVVVPEQPERVVVLSLDYLEALLAIGVEPVAAPSGYPFGPWVTEQIDVTDTSIFAFPAPSGGEVPIEQIAALQPDLIVGSIYSITADTFPLLSAIAPTVTHDDVAGDSVAGAWEDLTRQLGKALGREDDAEAVISDVLTLLEETRTSHAGLDGKTAVIAALSPNGIAATLGDRHSGIRMIRALGLEQADLGASGEEYAGGRLSLSTEQMALLDRADLLIMGAFSSDLRDELHASPLYQSLQVVQEERILDVDLTETYSFNTPTALNIPHLVEMLKPYLDKIGG